MQIEKGRYTGEMNDGRGKEKGGTVKMRRCGAREETERVRGKQSGGAGRERMKKEAEKREGKKRPTSTASVVSFSDNLFAPEMSLCVT